MTKIKKKEISESVEGGQQDLPILLLRIGKFKIEIKISLTHKIF
jgi:hypothetical protein